jgi:hypothetical protein
MNALFHFPHRTDRAPRPRFPLASTASQFARELGTTQTDVLRADRKRIGLYLRGAGAGLAMMVAGYAQNAEADILLNEVDFQGEYSLVTDASQPGYNIMGIISWGNVSDPVPANNQISANGSFGANQGLYKIDTTDPTHSGRGDEPTYTINPESFNIQYADGVVNTPNDSDTFKFYFNLGQNVTTESQAQGIVDNLNALINDLSTYTQDQPFQYKRDINGTIRGPPTNGSFENSPSVYVIPEPMTMTSLLVGMGALLGIKKFKEFYKN